MINEQLLIELAKYCTIVHHINGRIRVRVNPKLKELNKDVRLEDIESLPSKIKGIKNIKINKIVGSITIEYDSSIFPYHLWEDLILQQNTDKLVDIINNLVKEIA
ncbi:MAG: hypothetical protein RBQ81_01690 [Arcobacteraceae bacterium]|nr:hypothetical protein [Arcobacteraceae bacterium]